jgi:hypothetical protein
MITSTAAPAASSIVMPCRFDDGAIETAVLAWIALPRSALPLEGVRLPRSCRASARAAQSNHSERPEARIVTVFIPRRQPRDVRPHHNLVAAVLEHFARDAVAGALERLTVSSGGFREFGGMARRPVGARGSSHVIEFDGLACVVAEEFREPVHALISSQCSVDSGSASPNSDTGGMRRSQWRGIQPVQTTSPARCVASSATKAESHVQINPHTVQRPSAPILICETVPIQPSGPVRQLHHVTTRARSFSPGRSPEGLGGLRRNSERSQLMR